MKNKKLLSRESHSSAFCRCLSSPPIRLAWLLTLCSTVEAIAPHSATAQSITPAADGTGTIVTPTGNHFDIRGGTQSGANLFHSFQKFGLNSGEMANFISNPQIQNILGRVVGGDASVINGLMQVTGSNSNLFLMNPAGIIFGQNASLNVPASFTATTANGIGFTRGWFSAVGSNNYQALVGNPNRFAFTMSQPGSIINTANLAVGEGNNLSLIGGTVINTGSVAAASGNINIVAVPENNLVRLTQHGMVLSLEFEPITGNNGQLPTAAGISPLDLPGLLSGGSISNATGVTVNPDGTVSLTGSGLVLSPGGKVAIASGVLNNNGNSVAIAADEVELQGAIESKTLTINADAIALNGLNLAANDGNISFNGAVRLGGNLNVNAGAGAVTFTSTVDGDITGRRNLTLQAGGDVNIGGAIGGTVPLGSVSISGNNVTFGHYTGGALTVTAQGNIIGGVITARNYQQTAEVLGFETGDFTRWTTTGNARIETATFGSGPTEGTYQARITSAIGSVSQSQVETFLEVANGTLNSLGNGSVTQGSAMQSTFTAQAGDVVSFQWNFLTDELDQSVVYNDFGLITLTSASTSTLVVRNQSSFVPTTAVGFDGQTGFKTFSTSVPNSGTYKLGLGVVDVSDMVVASALLVDNVSITTTTATSGAPVNFSAGNSVQVTSINTQSASGTGGAVNITAGEFVRVTSTFTDQNGVAASISTAGSTGGGAINIQHSGGANNIPFIVGDATQNGTAGAISTGSTAVLSRQSFPNPGTVHPANDISITFANNPPNLSANSQLPEVQKNQHLTFSLADLNTLVHDKDNDFTSVVIEEILQGKLLRNGIKVEPGMVLEAGDVLVYIPPENAEGRLNAFTIKSSDRVSFSTPLVVSLNVKRDVPQSIQGSCILALKPLELREANAREDGSPEASSIESGKKLIAYFDENICQPSTEQPHDLTLPQEPILSSDDEESISVSGNKPTISLPMR
jgi:filamentous hemagglutinin family protein